MTEPELLTEVPAALKRLAKQVVRGFYGMDHALALDVLIRNPCVREEDMLELLKFDRKQLRSVLNTLKGDKFVKCRMRVETAPDGKTTRHNYYFINYRFSFLFGCLLNTHTERAMRSHNGTVVVMYLLLLSLSIRFYLLTSTF